MPAAAVAGIGTVAGKAATAIDFPPAPGKKNIPVIQQGCSSSCLPSAKPGEEFAHNRKNFKGGEQHEHRRLVEPCCGGLAVTHVVPDNGRHYWQEDSPAYYLNYWGVDTGGVSILS